MIYFKAFEKEPAAEEKPEKCHAGDEREAAPGGVKNFLGGEIETDDAGGDDHEDEA